MQQQQYDEWNQELSIVQDITEQTYYSTLLSTQPVFEKYKAVYESRKQDNSSLPILKEDQYRFLLLRYQCFYFTGFIYIVFCGVI